MEKNFNFNQKFEPPAGKVLHGAGQSPEQFRKYCNAVENYKPIIPRFYNSPRCGISTSCLLRINRF